MSITLARPAVHHTPRLVSAELVQRLDVFDVPTVIREHAWTLLQYTHGSKMGPDGPWWTMGAFTRGGVYLTVVARLQRDGMQYGFHKGEPVLSADPGPRYVPVNPSQWDKDEAARLNP